MKKFGMIMFSVLVLCMFSNTLMAQDTVRLTNGEWPPYLSKDLKYYGVSSRVVTDAFALAGVKVEYGWYPWKRAYKLAERGKWDGSLVWSRKPEREAKFYYSDPVMESKAVFFHRKDYNFKWKKINDLKGLKIGATLEYFYGKDFEAAKKAGVIKIDESSSDLKNFNKLFKKYINIFPCDLDVGYELLRKNFKPEQVDLFTYDPKPVRLAVYHLILSKAVPGNKNMMKRFNEGLKKLKQSGKFDQYAEESRRGDYKK